MRNKQQASNQDNKLTTCCVLCVYLCLRCKIEVGISLYKKSKAGVILGFGYDPGSGPLQNSTHMTNGRSSARKTTTHKDTSTQPE